MARYGSLNRASLSYDYLHTNSTTHEFLFGAIVELVDNSRDADASTINIYSIEKPELRGRHILCFLDDGCGMDQSEAAAVMTFGYSAKRLDPEMIGQYGNGLKSGAMRMGKDFLLFTKKSDVLTCVFMSRTFHEKEHIDEVIVPMPSFTAEKEVLCETEEERQKHETEMKLILQYSPFKTREQLLANFDHIQGKSGTLVMIYNLRLLDSGVPEMDFSDPIDVVLADPDGGDSSLVPEKSSLRAYLAVVYANPRMKIYIRDKKVCTRRVVSCLYKPRQYKYNSARFKARAEKEAAQAKDHVKIAQERQAEAESKLRDFEQRHGSNPVDRVVRVEWRQLQDAANLSKQTMRAAQDRAKEKEKHKNDPKSLTFVFGLNLERRCHSGCMIYNNGRLIKMYQKVGSQLDGGVKCAGVIGVVDVPYVVLEPTHNKQDFADSREYRAMLRVLGEYMDQYWKDINLAAQPGGVLQFWQNYGYQSNSWSQPPSTTNMFITRRMMSVQHSIQCNVCLQWRVLPFKSSDVGKQFPDTWTCTDNSDASCNKCSVKEKRLVFPEGKLEQISETVDKKREQLAKKIQKQQDQLDRLEKLENVTSSKQAAKIAEKNTPSGPVPSLNRSKNATKTPDSTPQSGRGNRSAKRSPSPVEEQRPKTKADLRKQLEEQKLQKEKEAAASAKQKQKEADRAAKQKQIEDDRRKKAKEEEKRKKLEAEKREKKKKQAAAEAAAAAKKKQAAATPPAARRGRQPVPQESDSEESSDEDEKPTPAQRKPTPKQVKQELLTPNGRSRSGVSPSKPQSAPAKSTPASSTKTSKATPVTQPTGSRRRQASPVPSPEEPAKKQTKSALKAVEARNADEGAVTTTEEVSSTSGGDKEKVEQLAHIVRRCVAFFLPPKWELSKSEVNKLSPDAILKLDLDKFFAAYENGLKGLVEQHQRSAEDSRHTVTNLRRMASKLLKTIQPDFAMATDCDSDEVDKLLAATIEAVEDAKNTN